VIALDAGAVATSSTTVRRWQRGDQALHHLVDPSTGGPVASPWRTASVVAATCVDANTAATAAIVKGPDAVGWLEATGLAARLVATDGAILRLGGWPEPLSGPASFEADHQGLRRVTGSKGGRADDAAVAIGDRSSTPNGAASP
jgi:thiamine biosynthesis lipoprotein